MTKIPDHIQIECDPSLLTIHTVLDPMLEAVKRQDKWDRRFVELAKHVASWSKDPSTQTGAVITTPDRRVVSVGYNGFGVGVQDLPERYADRETKYSLIVHCERNAMLFASRDLTGCTLYTWPFQSCAVCAGMVIQAGIKRCVAPYNPNPRWVEQFKLTQMQFEESGVELRLLDGYFDEECREIAT